MIPDCPITTENIKHADTLFGLDLATSRGKTVRHKPTCVVTDYVDIPRALVDINKQVTLVVDVMFVNLVPCLVSVSRMRNLITIEHAPKHTATKTWRPHTTHYSGLRQSGLYSPDSFHGQRVREVERSCSNACS